MTLSETASAIFAGPSRAFAVRLWDGTLLPPARDAGVRGRLALQHPRALSAFVPPSEHSLSEAYLDGELDEAFFARPEVYTSPWGACADNDLRFTFLSRGAMEHQPIGSPFE